MGSPGPPGGFQCQEHCSLLELLGLGSRGHGLQWTEACWKGKTRLEELWGCCSLPGPLSFGVPSPATSKPQVMSAGDLGWNSPNTQP